MHSERTKQSHPTPVDDGVDVNGAVVVLRAMAYEHRLRILVHLLDGETTAGTLSDALCLEATNMAHHLRHLREARLISRSRRGRHVWYRLGDDPVRRLVIDAMQFTGPAHHRQAS